jgi:hypothetical protein
MKNVFVLLTIALFAVSCSSIKITSDFDKTASFATYKTYKLTDEAMTLPINELNKNRIIAAVETELAAKGFTKSDSPDVLININLKGEKIQTATANNTGGYGYGRGYRYGYGGGYSTTTISYDSYLEGTLFVDMIDATKNELVWQGRGVGTIDEDATQAKREKNINYAVKQIFTKYPPVVK